MRLSRRFVKRFERRSPREGFINMKEEIPEKKGEKKA